MNINNFINLFIGALEDVDLLDVDLMGDNQNPQQEDNDVFDNSNQEQNMPQNYNPLQSQPQNMNPNVMNQYNQNINPLNPMQTSQQPNPYQNLNQLYNANPNGQNIAQQQQAQPKKVIFEIIEVKTFSRQVLWIYGTRL